MSLLMQALKKAEHAKKKGLQESQEPSVPADSPSNFPPIEAPAAAQNTTVRTEPELEAGSLRLDQPAPVAVSPTPDLPPRSVAGLGSTLTLETLPDKAEPQPTVTAEAPTKVTAEVTANAPQRFSQPAATPQRMAQNVMAASPKQGSNRMQIVGVAGILITVLAAAAIYYYWQSTLRQPAPVLVSVPANVQSPTQTPQPQAQQPVPAQPATPELKPVAGKPQQPALQTGSSARVAHRTVAQPLAINPTSGSTSASNSAGAPGEQIHVQHSQAASLINANLSKAYQLFMSGDSKGARPLYEAVLHEEHNNRDALLGLAAIALRQHQNEQAAALYSRLLDLDPADPDAIAGLTSLGKGDPERSESQLKKVLAHNQQFGPALFELGNVYAQQSRWAEAQDAYFRAFASTPGNASYAFNLAISLDRLGQSKLALDYYQKAVTLSNVSPGSFNPEAARQRAAQLQQTLNTEPANH